MTGEWLALGAAAALAAASAPPRAGSRGQRPAVGDRVRSWHYGGQPWLYHVTKSERLPRILEEGLRPGRGQSLGSGAPGLREHSRGRVFFSTQPDKWVPSVPGAVVVRVPTARIRCYYDGGQWIGDPGALVERLADCFSLEWVPPRLLDVVGPRAGT